MTINVRTATNADQTARKVGLLDRSIGGLSVRSLVGAAAIAQVAGAIINLASETLRTADEIDKFSRTIGISVEQLQRLQFVATQNGLQQETFNRILTRLTQGIGQAGDGLATYLRVFDRFGIAVRDQEGTLRGTEEVLLDLADAFAAAPNRAQATADIIQLVGSRGARLIPILQRGSAGIIELAGSLQDSAVQTQASIDSITAYNDALDRLGTIATGVTANALGPLLDTLLDLFNARDNEALRDITDDLDGLISQLERLQTRSIVRGDNVQGQIYENQRVALIAIDEVLANVVAGRQVDLETLRNTGSAIAATVADEELRLDLLRIVSDEIARQEMLTQQAAEASADSRDTISGLVDLWRMATEEQGKLLEAQEAIRREAERLRNLQIEANELTGEYSEEQARIARLELRITDLKRAGIDITLEEVLAQEQRTAAIEEAARASEEAARNAMRIADLQIEADLLTGRITRQEAERLELQRRIRELQEAGIDITLEEVQAHEQSMRQLEMQQMQLERIAEITEEIGDSIAETIVNGVREGAGAWDVFRDAANRALNDIAQQLISSGIQRLIGGLLTGAPGATGLLGSLFGGFRQNGGTVSRGRGYVVGENGPEYFVPGSSGNIVPNGELGGSTSNVYNLNISGNVDQRSIDQIRSVIRNSSRDVGQANNANTANTRTLRRGQ